MSHEGASALSVMRDRAGNAYIGVDSLVDLLAGMAEPMVDGPAKATLTKLRDVFRPISTYAEIDPTVSDDGKTMVARRCSTCRVAVVDGKRVGGEPIVLDAEPSPTGLFFPLEITDRVPRVGLWNQSLDRAVTIRLAEHDCAVTS